MSLFTQQSIHLNTLAVDVPLWHILRDWVVSSIPRSGRIDLRVHGFTQPLSLNYMGMIYWNNLPWDIDMFFKQKMMIAGGWILKPSHIPATMLLQTDSGNFYFSKHSTPPRFPETMDTHNEDAMLVSSSMYIRQFTEIQPGGANTFNVFRTTGDIVDSSGMTIGAGYPAAICCSREDDTSFWYFFTHPRNSSTIQIDTIFTSALREYASGIHRIADTGTDLAADLFNLL